VSVDLYTCVNCYIWRLPFIETKCAADFWLHNVVLFFPYFLPMMMTIRMMITTCRTRWSVLRRGRFMTASERTFEVLHATLTAWRDSTATSSTNAPHSVCIAPNFSHHVAVRQVALSMNIELRLAARFWLIGYVDERCIF